MVTAAVVVGAAAVIVVVVVFNVVVVVFNVVVGVVVVLIVAAVVVFVDGVTKREAKLIEENGTKMKTMFYSNTSQQLEIDDTEKFFN